MCLIAVKHYNSQEKLNKTHFLWLIKKIRNTYITCDYCTCFIKIYMNNYKII